MSNVAVVCVEGVGTSFLVAQRLRVLFPEHSFTHFGLMNFSSQGYDIVITFESMVPTVQAKSSANQKFRTYEGLFEAMGGAGTMESRLEGSSTDSQRVEALAEYLFSDAFDSNNY